MARSGWAMPAASRVIGKLDVELHSGDVGADHRLDVPVAGRLDLGVLDDRLHDRGAGSQRRGEVVVCGDAGQYPVDGRGLDGADLGQRGHALTQAVSATYVPTAPGDQARTS